MSRPVNTRSGDNGAPIGPIAGESFDLKTSDAEGMVLA
jgi:hypothetical protein